MRRSISSPWAHRSDLSLVGSLLLAVSFAGSSLAASPVISFDPNRMVACREVTPEEFALSNPTEKIVEARFQVSVLIAAGKETAVDELLIVISSPNQRFRVLDFSPRTELATDITGEIATDETRESSAALQGSLGGNVALHYGLAHVQGTPSLTAGVNNRSLSKETYKKLPPRQLILASGTTNAGHGVFFKIRRSTQTSLEGTHEFLCLFAVPSAWRGDWAMFECTASGPGTRYLSRSVANVAQAQNAVGLYLIGDHTARELTLQLARHGKVTVTPRADDQERRSLWLNEETSKAAHVRPTTELNLTSLLTRCWKMDPMPRLDQSLPDDPRRQFDKTLTALGRLADDQPSHPQHD